MLLVHQILTIKWGTSSMLYVLYEKSGVHSGRALRAALASRTKRPTYGGFPARLNTLISRSGDPDFIINLGCTEELSTGATVLNNRERVRAASNKRQARIAFRKADVPSPRLFLNASEVPESALPVVGRTSYHRKGQGFWLCRSKAEVLRAANAGATHFLEFVPNTREFRVHLFSRRKALSKPERVAEDYISAKISEKVWQGTGAPDPNEPQKNHAFGWTFLGPQGRREEELDVVRHVAKQAIACLGMDFGAVDVMYSIRNKVPYVLEVNSTPSLSDDNANTCEVYADRFEKLILTGKDDE